MLGKGNYQRKIRIFGNNPTILMDPNDPLYRLAKLIPWKEMTETLPCCSKEEGHCPPPVKTEES